MKRREQALLLLRKAARDEALLDQVLRVLSRTHSSAATRSNRPPFGESAYLSP